MEKITVTHFVNPHLFWFKIEPSDREELLELEYNISKIGNFSHDQQRTYKLGDCVVVYYLKWKKHVRGFVLDDHQRQTNNSYTIWLVDHGLPVVSDPKNMNYLPKEFRQPIRNVHRGGIADVMPKKLAHLAKNWPERSCSQLSNYLLEQKVNVFIKILYIQQSNQHIWCDLKVRGDYGGYCFVSDWLIQNNLAERIDRAEFKTVSGCFMTLKDFESNNKNKEQIEPSLMLDEVVQASQNKVNQWLKRNFMQTQDDDFFDEEDPSLNRSFQNVDCRTHVMLQAASKLLSSSKLPPMPDVSAFDLSCKQSTKSETVTKIPIKAQMHEMTMQPKVLEDQSYNVSEKKVDIQNLQKTSKPCENTEPYVSPFEDKYVRPYCKKRVQETSKFRMLPAGFDVTQLVEYRNSNHWHRSKTTLNMMVPHDDFVLENEKMQQEKEAKKLDYQDESENQFQHSAEDRNMEPRGQQASKSTKTFYIKSGRAVNHPMLNIPPPTDIELIGSAANVQSPQACWSELSCQLCPVKLGYNAYWRNIFLQLSGPEDIRQFDSLQKLLNQQAVHLTSITSATVESFELGRDYVVKCDDHYFRAQLQRILDNNCLRFFLVDLAFFHDVIIDNDSQNTIYESTHQIIKHMPFQAVHCSLVGVQLKPNSRINFAIDGQHSLYVYACIKEMNKVVVNLNINSYKVALFVCDQHAQINDVGIPQSATMLNRKFLTMQLANNDPDTELYLESDFGVEEDLLALDDVTSKV